MIEIRVLTPEDDRSRFHSGDPDLDRFFAKYAGQNQFRHHLGVTYIATEDQEIVGFVTLAAAQIECTEGPVGPLLRSPRYPLPVLRLARLAISEHARGRDVGRALVRFALGMGQAISSRIGCAGIIVDSKPGAVGFYEKLGFVRFKVFSGELGERPRLETLFLPLGSVPQTET